MSTPITKLSSTAKIYVGVVIVSGSAAVVQSAAALYDSPPQRGWVVLAVLTLLTGSLTLKIPTISARLSVSDVFVFCAVLWFGPSVATFIVVIETLVGTIWLSGTNRTPVRTLFNLATGAAAIWAASHLYELIEPLQTGVEDLLLP